MIGRLLAAAALALAPVATPAGAPAAQAGGPLVVAFVPGFTWRTAPEPLPGFAVGALVPATARRTAPCPADLWVTLSAGARAVASACTPPSYERGLAGVAVREWPEVLRANASHHYGARPGALAAAVRADGGCVAATGPYALLGAADPAGVVGEYHETLTPRSPGTGCAVQLADLTDRPSLRAAVDAVTKALDPSVLVLVGPPGEEGAHFGAVAVSGDEGLLTGSPREPGLVTIPDLTAQVARHARVARHADPALPGGTPPVARPDAAPYPRLLDLDRRDSAHRRYQGVYLAVTGGLPLLFYAALLRRRRAGAVALTRRDRAVALVLASMPAAGFLASVVPWWRAGLPWLACAAAAAVATLAIAGLGVLAGRVTRAGGAVGVAGVVTALFTADLLTGARLQKQGLVSYAAVAGGRFYGIGNIGFAVFATAAVITLGAAERRYGRRAWLAGIPLVAVDALARWGADFGGAVALTAALGTAAARRARRATVVAATALGVAVALAAAWLDYARPAADRTHLGTFVHDLLHGGWGDTVTRKVDANVHALTHTWGPLFLAASVAAGVWLLRRRRDPALDTTVRALAVLWVVGSLVNDTGVIVAASGAAVAVPLLLAYQVETQR